MCNDFLNLLSSVFILRKKNQPFLLEHASNFSHDFLYDNFNKKILLNLMHFQGEMVRFFP